VLISRSPPGTWARVKARKPRPVGPAHRLRRLEKRQAKRHAGSPRRKRRRYLAKGGSFEGRIPGAPPVRNKTGAGLEGVTRREGSQTLRTDPSGQAKPAASGSRAPDVLKGTEVQERCRPGNVRPARPHGQRLWRKAELDERQDWPPDRDQSHPPPENRIAGETANGTVEPLNP
jgi:hypothetical protein